MKVCHSPFADREFQYTVEPHSPAQKAALDAIRHWQPVEDLCRFALARHGYGDTDGCFGITYPGDLDDHDRACGESIKDGWIEVEAGYGDPHTDPFLLRECEYLELLRQYLTLCNRPDLAAQLPSMKS